MERSIAMQPGDTLRRLFANGGRPRCYVASPLGFSETTGRYYREEYLPTLAQHVEPVDPWSLTTPEEIAEARAAGKLYEFFLVVAERNTNAIAGSGLIVAQLDGQEVDSGTAAEIGYAVGLGKPALGIRSDLRQAGEPEMAVNLQVEGLIVQSGGFVAVSLDDLCVRLAGCASSLP
jgi:nucleoside 2-deoxyribosyltransferase